MEENDDFDLQRFVHAQDPVYDEVRAELRDGCKRGHWMWFVFPQIEGLGYSFLSQLYALRSRAEAEAYLEHPVLGPRLRECTELVTRVDGRSIVDILGDIDSQKFRSSMTLFAHATADNQAFVDALEKYFGGRFDRLTLERL